MTKLAITLWRSLRDTENGIAKAVTWKQLGEFLNSPAQFSDADTSPGWSAVSFELNKRDLPHVVAAHALVLDFDGTAVSDVLRALFVGETYFIHSSKNNREGNPRYRAVLQISRPVNREDYYRIWRAYTRPFSERVDQACKDPARFWFMPCRTADTLWEFWSGEGTPLDVEQLIKEAKALEAKEEEARAAMAKVIQRRPDERETNAVKRASRYIEKMEPAISGSHGHDATWAVACTLVKGFGLDRKTALAILASEYNPRCVPPWSMKDLERKIDQAATKTRELTDGYLLVDRDNWSPTHRAKIPPTPPPDADPDYIPEPPIGWDDPDGVAVPDDPEAPACERDEPIATGNESAAEPATEPKEQDEPVTAAERYNAWSAQKLALEVLTDVNRPQERGCPTGIGDIDLAICGMRPKMITVFGASTSMGKSTAGIMAADETCKVKKRPLILTFEDEPLMYGRRLVARRGRLNFVSLRDRDTSARERAEIIKVAGAAEKGPFLVDCTGKTAEYAAKAILELVKEEGIDLVIVDYLQRIKTERRLQDRRNEVTYAVATISDAIKIAGAAGMLLSQLKRLQDGKKPTNEDLKESGDIECFAENIILGWREFQQDSTEEKYCILTKAKDGQVILEPIRLDWNPVSASFNSTAPSHPADNGSREYHRFNEDIDEAITNNGRR